MGDVEITCRLAPAPLLALLFCGTACGGGEAVARGPAVPQLARTAESRHDVAELLTEAMAAEVCDQVRGRFLPIAHTEDGGPSRGDEPVGGRWWVRDCRVQIYQGQVALYLAGTGWAWAKGSKGFGLRWGTADYVIFAAGGTVLGTTDLGWDPVRKTAWVQFRPSAVPFLQAAPTSRLEAHGNIPGKLFSGITFGIFSGALDDKANDAALEQITAAFLRQLSAGFAMSYDPQRRQRDVMALNASAAPLRPFTDGVRWLVNERQVLHRKPGGVHVVGPFAPTPTANVDFRVEDGSVQYRAECETSVAAWFEPVLRGAPPALPPVTHGQAGVLGSGASTRTLTVLCPWYLLTEPLTDAVTVDVRVRADRSAYPAAGL